ncbi:5-oxoprolinase subunit PxpB [Alicyclobacillus shizuokensis]|uniref:5-oxoprolinase subunit PxpB n=1 Tax=Alicyclobacillus shizuokensis TaxID=392014 RepID=UPI000AF957A8|nr:5-oxoprolinase subunit PxpB [Alicyclobacillus shizuokensis]
MNDSEGRFDFAQALHTLEEADRQRVEDEVSRVEMLPLGDIGVLVRFGDTIDEAVHGKVLSLARALEAEPAAGFRECVPAFAAVAVYYDPSRTDFERVSRWILERMRASSTDAGLQSREVEIPVCYGGALGPDLADVAAHTGLSEEEVVRLHGEGGYRVYMIGFAPGFPYLGGLPARLATPRLAEPRTQIPAGSVGIAGQQTGVYPLATPGGWRIIGRTPVPLFRPEEDPPSLLAPGDTVRFRAISREEYDRLAAESAHRPGEEGPRAEAGGTEAQEASRDAAPPPAAWQEGGQSDDAALRPGIRAGAEPGGRLEVLQPGLLTTVQDLGRHGYQKYGVSVSGAMDTFALRVANLLVGNPEGAPALEMTVRGPKLRFTEDTLVALAGFGMTPHVAGREVPTWRPVLVRGGQVLEFEPNPRGCRMYLAALGGIAVPEVLGSASTYLRAGMGGWRGRALKAGDVLPLGSPSALGRMRQQALAAAGQDAEDGSGGGASPFVLAAWTVDPGLLPDYRPNPRVRVLPGAQVDAFSEAARSTLARAPFTITPQSDRMGYRLRGPRLAPRRKLEMVSEPTAAGAVQVPGLGHPVVLLADCQTTGGYSVIAQVMEADLPVIAQARPGESLRFVWVTLEQARAVQRKREQGLAELRVGLSKAAGLFPI